MTKHRDLATDDRKVAKTENPVKIPKERLLTFERYADRQDLLTALLDDGKDYSIKEVDRLINGFMKGKVN